MRASAAVTRAIPSHCRAHRREYSPINFFLRRTAGAQSSRELLFRLFASFLSRSMIFGQRVYPARPPSPPAIVAGILDLLYILRFSSSPNFASRLAGQITMDDASTQRLDGLPVTIIRLGGLPVTLITLDRLPVTLIRLDGLPCSYTHLLLN